MTDTLIEKPASAALVRPKLRLNIRWQNWALPLGVFLVALLPRLLNLDAFLTADEDDQIMFAHLFLKAALQGDWGGALVLGYPGVPTLILGGLGVGLRYLAHFNGWLPLPWAAADLMTTLNQVTTRFGVFSYPADFLVWVRAPMALLASVNVLLLYWLARRLLDARLALLGTLIIAFDPFILAHSRVIHVDAPLAYFMFLSFLAFLLYLEQGVWKWLVFSGVFGGLAALSKTPAAVLGPILVVSGLAYALLPPPDVPRRVRWQRLIIALVGWAALAALAFFALWPSMWTRPAFALEWIINNIVSVNNHAHPTTGIFWGNQQTDQNPLYYLIVFPYHLTPLTTGGVLVGLGMIGAGLWQRRRSPAGWLSRHLPLAMSLVAYVVIFAAPVSAISRRGDRYILPVFFAGGLLSALALWWLAQGIVGEKSQIFQKFKNRFNFLTPFRLAGAVVLAQIVAVLLYHPYYLAYFNPVLGGGRTAPYHINVGWGEGLDLAADYLNRATGQPKRQVAAWYSNQFSPYYHGPTVDLSDQTSALTADTTVFYINQVQRGFPSGEILSYFWQRQPEYVVRLGGMDYAWIFAGPVVSRDVPKNYAFAANVVLGGGARLVGLDIPQSSAPVDAYTLSQVARAATFTTPYTEMKDGLPVTLYWETLAKISGEHNVYIRLVDEKGIAWGQVDRMILSGLWRPDRWRGGYFLRDEYRLPIDPATPPGVYHFEVGLYDFDTGQSYGVARNIGQLILTPPRTLPHPENLKLTTAANLPLPNNLTMVGHDFVDRAAPPGAEIQGKIFWQAARAVTQDFQVEFSLLGTAGEKYVITQEPLSAAYPASGWRRGEIVGAAYRFRIPAAAPPGTYPVAATLTDPQSGAAIGPAVTLAAITVEAQARSFTLPQDVTPVSAYINDELELVGYKLHDQAVAPRETFGLTLYWRSLRPAQANYSVFVHAVGPDQVMRGQWDTVPAQGSAPTVGWLPGEIIEDKIEVPMVKDAPPWKYDIFVGMYDSLTGERLPAASLNAPVSDNRVWLTRVQVTSKK